MPCLEAEDEVITRTFATMRDAPDPPPNMSSARILRLGLSCVESARGYGRRGFACNAKSKVFHRSIIAGRCSESGLQTNLGSFTSTVYICMLFCYPYYVLAIVVCEGAVRFSAQSFRILCALSASARDVARHDEVTSCQDCCGWFELHVCSAYCASSPT